MADGPQSPLWLSARLSHSWMRPWSSRWKAFEVSPLPWMARTIWTPAGAHHVIFCSWAKTFLWLDTMSTSTATRAGVGTGVAVGTTTGVGDDPTEVAAVADAAGSGDGSISSGSRSSTATLAWGTSTVRGADRSGTGPAMSR